MTLLNPGAQRQLVAAFRAAAHASTDDHFIEQARGAEQALAEDRLDVERVRQNFSRLVEAMCAEASIVAEVHGGVGGGWSPHNQWKR